MKILALVDCVQSYGRNVLAGVARFANARGGWRLVLDHANQSGQRLPRSTDGLAGIIAYAFHRRLVAQLRGCGVPAVNTSSAASDVGMPAVLPDDRAIGALAADDLVARGYRELVALRLPLWHYSKVRAEAFVERARELGVEADVLALKNWSRAEASIRQLLEQRRTPLGVFSGSDMLAVFVVRQAHELRMSMPEQVAVLGVDNDELTAQMMEPRISSVVVPWEKLGFQAATLLDRLITGEPVDPEPILVAPTGIVTRQTTDGLAIDDEEVTAAIWYIRNNLANTFTIEDVLSAVPLSRRMLELRFKRCVGQTLQHYITALRLERSKQLLSETDYSMPEIAARCGFPDASYFATVFRRHVHKSPTAFRADCRLG